MRFADGAENLALDIRDLVPTADFPKSSDWLCASLADVALA
jgi:hypothetical protein